jgi:hypothetical protein
MTFKLGKTPARPWQAPGSKFRLGSYLAGPAALPELPTVFGHQSLVTQWGMLANDRYGCCVWAGAAHETMLLNKEAGAAVAFTDGGVLSDYAAATGFNANDPSTDQGTDVQEAAAYRRRTGVLDAAGKRHTIAAYLGLDPGNVEHLLLASFLFSAVGIGLSLPASAIDQAKRGQTWDVVAASPNEGGHYVPLVGRLAPDTLVSVSWGQAQLMTARFFQTFCDEAVAYVSTEDLIEQKSPEGFSYADLISDLAALAGPDTATQ